MNILSCCFGRNSFSPDPSIEMDTTISTFSLQSGNVSERMLKGDGVISGDLNTTAHRVYEGCFKDGVFHGEGALKVAGVEVYRGDWVNGLRQGYGVQEDENGIGCSNYLPDRYEGQFLNDRRHGFGVLTSKKKWIRV